MAHYAEQQRRFEEVLRKRNLAFTQADLRSVPPSALPTSSSFSFHLLDIYTYILNINTYLCYFCEYFRSELSFSCIFPFPFPFRCPSPSPCALCSSSNSSIVGYCLISLMLSSLLYHCRRFPLHLHLHLPTSTSTSTAFSSSAFLLPSLISFSLLSEHPRGSLSPSMRLVYL